MGIRRNVSKGRQRRNFAYPFQVADDAMQMGVHKTLYLFYPISLCWLNHKSQFFVWNVLYTSATRNASSFHKLPNIHFFEHCLEIGHNSRIINYLPRCLCSTVTCRAPIQWFQINQDYTKKSPYLYNKNPETLCYKQNHMRVLIWIETTIEYWFNYSSSSNFSSAAQKSNIGRPFRCSRHFA